MKEVDFVEIKTRKVLVHKMDDYYRYQTMDGIDSIVHDSMEIIPEIIKEKNTEIKRIVNDGIESYFSVDRLVWEKLCLFENPVTVNSLIEERDRLENESMLWKNEAIDSLRRFKDLNSHCKNASLWQRIKWVFTGFKGIYS